MTRGLSFLDLLVTLAVLVLLVYVVRHDWSGPPAPPTTATTLTR